MWLLHTAFLFRLFTSNNSFSRRGKFGRMFEHTPSYPPPLSAVYRRRKVCSFLLSQTKHDQHMWSPPCLCNLFYRSLRARTRQIRFTVTNVGPSDFPPPPVPFPTSKLLIPCFLLHHSIWQKIRRLSATEKLQAKPISTFPCLLFQVLFVYKNCEKHLLSISPNSSIFLPRANNPTAPRNFKPEKDFFFC